MLLGVLIACALALVTSQHKARKLFTELEKEQELAKQIDVEWGQLQLEQSTWAMHARIEKIASANAADARAAAGARAPGRRAAVAAPVRDHEDPSIRRCR